MIIIRRAQRPQTFKAYGELFIFSKPAFANVCYTIVLLYLLKLKIENITGNKLSL